MLLRILASSIVLTIASPASGMTCAQAIVSSGSLFSGQQFATQLTVPGLTKGEALRKLSALFRASGLRVTLDDRAKGLLKANIGAKLLEPARAIDIHYSQNGDTGVIHMAQRYPPGIIAPGGLARKQICAALAQVRAKEMIPTAYTSVAVARRVIPVRSIELATQVRRAQDNPARIRTEFVDQLYRVNGRVLKIREAGDGYTVAFEADPEANERNWPRIALTCQVGNPRAAAALTLNEAGTLIGRFARYDEYRATPTIMLEDCKAP